MWNIQKVTSSELLRKTCNEEKNSLYTINIYIRVHKLLLNVDTTRAKKLVLGNNFLYARVIDDRRVPCPQVVDDGDNFHLRRITVNILNKQSWTAEYNSPSLVSTEEACCYATQHNLQVIPDRKM
jgi:hypothetical protein